MKLNFKNIFQAKKSADLTILLGTHTPDPEVLDGLAQISNLTMHEAFTTHGVLQNLSGVQLVILGDLIPVPDLPQEVLHSALDRSGITGIKSGRQRAACPHFAGHARVLRHRCAQSRTGGVERHQLVPDGRPDD